MNSITYLLYLGTTYFITVHVGLSFYRNGRIYILNLLEGDERLTGFINRLLLTGYYLLNLGYVALTLHHWPNIDNWSQALAGIGTRVGRIMLILALVHYVNMLVILLLSRNIHHSHHHKI
ncbi:MAG: hypothetical protein P0Y53_09340 [Candidatus Pseudobacter hemicellulosilyticus]|uniref:Integral membrane protein n=1 Tax=Candidatus Pseudobacter hemicellulosilyticus TaxID=3121375 RepID=A0AAJ5WVS5_9BACT|nr:MAG: hypothetical protein P0Y53_09340 [Pseudobacter sp.]